MSSSRSSGIAARSLSSTARRRPRADRTRCRDRSRGTAIGIATALAAASYLRSSLAPVVHWLRPPRFASLFYWADGNHQLSQGASLASFAVLASVRRCRSARGKRGLSSVRRAVDLARRNGCYVVSAITSNRELAPGANHARRHAQTAPALATWPGIPRPRRRRPCLARGNRVSPHRQREARFSRRRGRLRHFSLATIPIVRHRVDWAQFGPLLRRHRSRPVRQRPGYERSRRSGARFRAKQVLGVDFSHGSVVTFT